MIKKAYVITILASISLMLACETSSTVLPNLPEQEQPEFELLWASRMDYEKEIVGTDNTQHYKDWMLVGGDIDLPPTIMAFNKETGDKDWELVFEQFPEEQIFISSIFDNVYIARTSRRVFAVDLNNQELLWQKNLKALGMRLDLASLAINGKYYQMTDYAFNTGAQIRHLYEFDPVTGENEIVISYPQDETGITLISPPTYWENNIILFNEYPDAETSPEESVQYIVAYNKETKEFLWRTKVTDSFASNGGHPPIIYNKLVITGGDSSIYAFDIETGTLQWRFEMDYPWSIWNKTNHLIYNDRLYVNNGQEDVTCLNPLTGELIWNNPKGGANCTDNMVYYEKEDLLVFTSWGYGSVMILDALTGETVHREHRYDNSSYNNDVVYDAERDLFFTSTYKHAVAFKVRMPE